MKAPVTRIAASSQGEARLRMMRLVRRGDRHDPRDLTVSFRFEGDFEPAFTDGRAEGLLPGEAIRTLVHNTARQHGARELEELGLALAADVLERQARITRVRVELTEQPWHRLEAGGKAQGQAFVAASPEQRVAIVTSNGPQTSVVAGIDHLTIMRSAGFTPPRRGSAGVADESGQSDGLQPLLVGELAVRWTYTTGDITFGVYRQGVRNAVLDTFAWHQSQSVQHVLYAVADVVLATCQEILDVTLSFHERPYRPADLFAAGTENPDELFVVVDEPLGVVEVTVERSN
jgi:urate oxidase